jgi:hypothetical protein
LTAPKIQLLLLHCRRSSSIVESNARSVYLPQYLVQLCREYTCLVALLATLLLLRVTRCFHYLLNPCIIYLFGRLWGPVERFRATLHLLHFGCTLACNIVGINSFTAAQSRAGSLALLHLIPLLITPHLNMAASIFGLSLPAYRHVHQAIGLIAVLQNIIHIVVAVPYNTTFHITGGLQYGLMAISFSPPSSPIILTCRRLSSLYY